MSADIDSRRTALASRFRSWEPVTLDQFLRRSAAEFGGRPFVITDDRTISYAEADAWADRLADGLAAAGVRPGDRVGIVMANYLEFVPVKFAVARAGAVAIPFNYLYRQEELGYVLRQSQCNALIMMTRFGGLDYLEMLDGIAPGWETGGGDALPALRRVVLLPTAGSGGSRGAGGSEGAEGAGGAGGSGSAGGAGGAGGSRGSGVPGAPGARACSPSRNWRRSATRTRAPRTRRR